MRRRELLARAGVGGRAVFLGGLAGALYRPSEAAAQAPAGAAAQAQSDATIVAYLVSLEQLAVLACRRVLASGELSHRQERDVRALLAHERAHVAAQTQELSSLGGATPAPLGDAAADALLGAHHASGRISSLHSAEDCLHLLLDVEGVLIGAYFDAISKLHAPAALRRSVEIMGSEAQHASLLGQLLTPRDFTKITPVPFVQGTR